MSLRKCIKENPNMRLLFGKKEIEIIQKQLLGIALTPLERMRLSRDIRKKLKAIKEISKYQEEFELKKAQEIKKIINESKETILKIFPDIIKEIILYGSYAIKNPIKGSDIDLALKLKETNIPPTKIRVILLGRLDSKIDLQIFSQLPKKIQTEINKHGKVIYKYG